MQGYNGYFINILSHLRHHVSCDLYKQEKRLAGINSVDKPGRFLMTGQNMNAQLIMKCSGLNFHLFSLHVVDSPACPCGHDCEDSNHYLLQCPLFYKARNMLLNEIRELTMTDISCELFLYVSADLGIAINKKVFDAVHRFINETGRL